MYFAKDRNKKHNGNLACPQCRTGICHECDQREHTRPGDMCPAQKIAEDAQSRNYRLCPGCRKWTQKDGGCQHLTCSCGTQWCWSCGNAWTFNAQGRRTDIPGCGSYDCRKRRTPQLQAQLARYRFRHDQDSVAIETDRLTPKRVAEIRAQRAQLSQQLSRQMSRQTPQQQAAGIQPLGAAQAASSQQHAMQQQGLLGPAQQASVQRTPTIDYDKFYCAAY